jgi:hypothetical protein
VDGAPSSCKGHRYPVEIIAHCVWPYFRFPLGFREVGELMLERGVPVSHETVRRWCATFGQARAGALRRRRPRPDAPSDSHTPDNVTTPYRARFSPKNGTVSARTRSTYRGTS